MNFTTDAGSELRAAIERQQWYWNRCACHVIDNGIKEAFQILLENEELPVYYAAARISTLMNRSNKQWTAFLEIQRKHIDAAKKERMADIDAREAQAIEDELHVAVRQ